MSKQIGAAGRRSVGQAHRLATGAHHRLQPAPARFSNREVPLPFVQRAAPASPATGGPEPAGTPESEEPAGATVERETAALSPQAVADRVYDLLCQDLRRDRERCGWQRLGRR